MQRSQCENENVQFVQELADVDGPFESPININYRGLTKLELPSLCWNRSEVCPQKMKVTNTGHTVIISGKWKCERPYLTGGPLVGKYVFSQIHFHWGQEDCKGSEHQICGEGFPLEMHVAHFKADYLSQENALREKDGMVVAVYLFKLQSESNPAFKKILSLLPSIKQPCTSQALEPRPIMSLINPFTDDYFLYWGSVITPTCAHILLWMICREPFGISREQVEEFRTLMDSSQHPICKNSRDVQPVHKRNVFHVNAGRDLDKPLLPIKQMLGCYCRGSEDNISFTLTRLEAQPAHDCSCPVYYGNQEEIEETVIDNKAENISSDIKGTENWDCGLTRNPYLKQYVYVQNAIITPAPLLAKKFESEMIKKVHYPVGNQVKSEACIRTNFRNSESCCFYPMEKINQIKPRPDRRKKREKKLSNSFGAFSNILSSLEALKNHTFKKLREIDAINQEIKGMKSFCQNAEDKRWLWKIEKVMTTQKRFTLKRSQNCFGELKKLAKECNFDKFFDNKQFPTTRNYQKIMEIKNDESVNANPALPCPDTYAKKGFNDDNLVINQETKFSLKAQKLIQSFFEDIKDSEDLQKTVRKNLQLKKTESLYSKEAGDYNLVSKGCITQKMFTMGNLGDRFFTEVTTEADTEEEKVEEVIITVQESLNNQESEKFDKKYKVGKISNEKNDSVIPLHKATELTRLNELSKSSDEFENYFSVTENQLPHFGSSNETGTTSDENLTKGYSEKKLRRKHTVMNSLENYLRKLNETTEEKFQRELRTNDTLASMWYSNSNFLTDSTETQKMFIAKFHKAQSRGDLWKRKSLITKISSKKVLHRSHRKSKVKNFSIEGYYLKKKKKHSKKTTITSSCDLSSSSRETSVIVNKSKWKRLTKAKLKLAIEKSINGSSESELEYRIISPKRKKLKLDTKKKNATPTENLSPKKSREIMNEDDAKDVTNNKGAAKEEETIGKTTNERSPEPVALAEEPLEKYREAVTQTATSVIELKSSGGKQRDSNVKIFKTTSAETRNDLVKRKIDKSSQDDEELVKMAEEIPKRRVKKNLAKNKSLTSLTNSPKFFSTETPVRLFVENIDSRRKCFRDPPDMKKIGTPWAVESAKKLNEVQKEPDEEVQTELICSSEKTIPEVKQEAVDVEYKVGFFTTSVRQADEELIPINQIQREKSKIPLVKRGDGQKYGFLRKKCKEANDRKQQPIDEVPVECRQTESKKSLTNDNDKNDEEHVVNDEVETSVFFTSVKKTSASRSYSAESLNSLSRPLKRKNKKRPHICKRSSKHFIRKNSLSVRKPNKVESKPLQRVNVPYEEQLKSITHDVARYLRQNFAGYENEPDTEENIVKGIEEIMLKNLKAPEENQKEPPAKEASGVKQKEAKQDATGVVKKPEQKIPRLKQETKPVTPVEIPEKKPPSRKPVHDFIKRNKLMAGKYKRGPSPAEKPTEVRSVLSEPKQMNKKKGKVLPGKQKETHVHQPQPNSQKPENLAGNMAEVKERPTRIPKSLGKLEKIQEKLAPSEETVVNQSKQQKPENLNCPASEMAVRKVPPPNSLFLPAYMMTSYLPPPIEIVQNQQKQMNKYLLNGDVGPYGPEMLKETLKQEKNDFSYKKELEYLLSLQRCMPGEVTSSIENSMNYVKTLLSQEYNGSPVLADTSANEPLDYYKPLQYSDSGNSGIVLIEMSDLMESSTSNSDLSGYFKIKPMDTLSQQLKNKIYISKAPQDYGDPGILNPILNCQEEWCSDSNYDCQIFITLSTNSNEAEGGTPSQGTIDELSSGTQEVVNQFSTYSERSSSQSVTLKQHRKKRKDNEISAEMKQKLLEILETEIKREMGIESSTSVETHSDGNTTYNLDDSEGNRESQSTGSFDNVEVLAQISETMRQYLSGLNERKLPGSADEAE